VLTKAQLLRVLVAATARVSPFDVSLPLLVGYLLRNSAPGRNPIAAFAGGGVRLGFIQPSRRIRIAGPDVPIEMLRPPPMPPWLVRQPRYAHRTCERQPKARASPPNSLFVAPGGVVTDMIAIGGCFEHEPLMS
jgi:hypothetical protein